MTREQWEQIERLYEQALSRPAGERAGFLAEHCDDAALQQEVASLLELSEEADDYFDQLAGAVPAASGELRDEECLKDPLELEGRQVRCYAVEEHLGGGGMGVVYRRSKVSRREARVSRLPQEGARGDERLEIARPAVAGMSSER